MTEFSVHTYLSIKNGKEKMETKIHSQTQRLQDMPQLWKHERYPLRKIKMNYILEIGRSTIDDNKKNVNNILVCEYVKKKTGK